MKWYSKVQFYPWYGRMSAYGLVFLSVAGISALITFMVLVRFIKVEVPDLRGMSLPEAVDILDNVGLTIDVNAETPDQHVPAGHVIEQGIEPGSRIKGRSRVGVVLSKGVEARRIPNVTGMSLKKAEKVFQKEGLSVTMVIKVHSSRIYRGRVIAQRPAPDEWTGEPITLIVSAGRRDVIYYNPRFTGMTRDDALLLASKLGLKATITATGGGQIVVQQRPEPGVEIKKGSAVQIKLGGGI